MLQRLKHWWRRWLCRRLGHDEEELWSETFPLLPPEPAPEPVVVPDGALGVEIRGHPLDAYVLWETRCRRCGAQKTHGDLTRVGPVTGIPRVRYIELPPDRYEPDEHGRPRRKAE
jgi:hypothetical protein